MTGHPYLLALRISAAILSLSLVPQAIAGTCPLAVATNTSLPPVAIAPEDASCLVNAADIQASQPIYDLRNRAEYLELSIPGATHSSPAEIPMILRGNPKTAVIYTDGKFRSDAYQLCARLRSAGVRNFRILDGGIARWAQASRSPDRLRLGRLSDQEVSALLTDPRTTGMATSDSFRKVLSEHGVRQGTAGSNGRRVLITDASTPDDKILSILDSKGAPAFYWKGSHDQLLTLIHAHLAQNQKRLAGPAQSAACSAL